MPGSSTPCSTLLRKKIAKSGFPTREAAHIWAQDSGHNAFPWLIHISKPGQNPSEASKGIKFVLGILKRGGKRVSEVQSVLFEKAQWTVADAKKWLKDQGFKVPTVDDAKNFFRFRQTSPAKYKEMRTIEAGARQNPEPLAESLSGHLALTSDPFFRKQPPEIQAAMMTGMDLAERVHNPTRSEIIQRHGSSEDLGQQAFDAAKSFRLSGAYSETGVSNARVAKYGFLKWYNNLGTRETKGYRKSSLLKAWMQGWAAGKHLEKKRNPFGASQSAALSEAFHGRPPQSVTTLTEDMVERVDFMEVGDLVELKVRTPSGYDVVLQFPPKGRALVKLCSSPDGKQLYFRGGDQKVPLDKIHMGAEKWRRDKMVLGELRETVYRAQKKFDGFKPYDYAHKNSELSKKYPVLIYDTLNDQLEVAGGTGFITWRGLED